MKQIKPSTAPLPEIIPFTDQVIFSLVMRDKEICKELLQRILPEENFEDIRLAPSNNPLFPEKEAFDLNLRIETEKSIKLGPDIRGVRFDAFVKQRGTWADIEIQTYADEDICRRSRWYHANMDLDYLEPGHSYKDLPTAYVIFICTLDCLGQGFPLYTIRSQVQETGLLFGDESVTLILNTKCAPELVPEPLKELYAYINDPQNKFSDPLIEKIDARVKKFNSAEWRRRQMTFGEMLDRSEQKGIEQGIELGIEQGITAFIAAYLEEGKSKEQILTKLEAHFHLTSDAAEEYYRKYTLL